MDALQLLESEHDDLEALVAKLEHARGTEARHLFAAAIRETLASARV